MSDKERVATNHPLEEIYTALADGHHKRAFAVHVPLSDVFYVRAHLEEVFGQKFDLDYVERCMFLEGMLSRDDVLDPDREREWE